MNRLPDYKKMSEEEFKKIAIATGCFLVVGAVLVAGSYRAGKHVGSENTRKELEQEYEGNYNLPANYTLSDAPLSLLRDWADFAYGRWSDGKINNEHYRLDEKAQSVYEGPFCEFMRAYYNYYEICEEAAYFPNSEERIIEAEQ